MACNRNRSGYNNNWNNGNRCGWNGGGNWNNWYGCGCNRCGAWSNWNNNGCGNWNRCNCNRCNGWNQCGCAATSLAAEVIAENSCNSCSCE